MPIDFQSNPDMKRRLQSLAVDNGKTVSDVAAMSDEDLAMFACEMLIAALQNPQTGPTTEAMLSHGLLLSQVGSGGARASAPVGKATAPATDPGGPMTEERRKVLMGNLAHSETEDQRNRRLMGSLYREPGNG